MSLLKESLFTISLGAGFGVNGGGFGFGGVASAPTLVTEKITISLKILMILTSLTMKRTWRDSGHWFAGSVGQEGELRLGIRESIFRYSQAVRQPTQQKKLLGSQL